MLELSWDGFIEHTSQGWNVGKPPYGYLAEKVPHPVPARRAEGRTKHRLIPDPSRASAVTYIFQLRGLDKLGYDAIADRLNLDLVAYPPPEPARPEAALGRWSGSAVREILRNPKYTGYQVWNRRAMKKGGCYNDPKDWVWSPRPAHEPLVTKELFDVVSTVGRQRRGSRTTHGANAHPATKRSYILRSYVYCDICDRRMFGKTRHQIPYFTCQLDPNEHRDRPWFPSHPKSLWIREEILLASVSRFFATRIFGPDRRSLLTAALEAARSADDTGDRIAKERAALERAITAIGQRQARLIRTLADGFGDDEADDLDPDQEKEFRDAIRQEHATLGARREQLAEQLARLQSPKQAADPADTTALLDALPHLDVDLALVPEEIQRRLYNAFGLEVRYSRPREELTLRVMIPGCLLDGLVSVTRELDPWNKKSGARTEVLAPDHGTQGGQSRQNRHVRSHFSSAPGGGHGAWGLGEPLIGGAELVIQTVVRWGR